MITYQPKVAPLKDAVAKLSDRTPIGSKLKSADWEGVPLALRERAFFAAQVEEANRLQAMKEHLDRAIALVKNPDGTFANRSTFIGDMKKQLAALGYASDPELKGTLQDLTSRARLGLIYDQQIRSAQGYAEWKTGQDQGALDAYPAQELIRVAGRRVPRQWHSRWIDAGGPTPDGRLIALKSDPIWSKISRFGVPWPPFDFQSGMGLRDISRQEAEQLGLIAPEDKPVRPDIPFNDNLQASLKNISPQYRQGLEIIFGDTIDITGDLVRWKTGRHSLAISMDVLPGHPKETLIKGVLADIANIHSYTDTAENPGIPLTPIRAEVDAPTTDGGQYHANHPKTNGPRIDINPKQGNELGTALDIAHEIGHEIDHLLFGSVDTFGSHFNSDLDHLMQAIEQSNEIQSIKAMKIHGKSELENQKREYQEYVLRNYEMFARAYSQWIAERSGRTEYIAAIESKISEGWGTQWEKKSFAPIAAEFEKLFKAKGWLR